MKGAKIMENPVETIDYRGYQINVHCDQDAMDPRKEFDNLGTMICFSRRHNIGDKHDHSDVADFLYTIAMEADPTVEHRTEYWESGNGWATIAGIKGAVELANSNQQDIINKAIEKHYIMLPIYMYDHSGITISTGPFSCKWDSGQVGFIYISKKKAKKEYNWKNMSRDREKTIKEYLEGEVETYNQYLTGDVYGYFISNEEDDHIDSCWGFYGHDFKNNGLLEMAQNAIDCELRKEFEATEFVKNCFAL